MVALEAGRAECEKWRRSVAQNGWEERATLINAFIGGETASQQTMRQVHGSAGVPVVTEDDLVRTAGLNRVDFLKCDIEGSEFDLLRPGGRLLGMARQIGVEVHAEAGSMEAFERMLDAAGFEVRAARRTPGANVLLARRL